MPEKKTKKFEHLDNIDPNVKKILNFPITEIYPEHLKTVSSNLSEYSTHKNPEIAQAALDILERINKITSFWIWDKRISSEIVNATATADDYNNILAA